MFKKEIEKVLQKHVKDGELEIPPDSKLGDYAFACFRLAKEQKRNPADLAKELAKKIEKPDCVEKITAEGPYVNFYIKTEAIAEDVVKKVLKQKECYGSTDIGKGKTIAMDYSHPNIGKPFHVGHLRSTIIGQCLYNIFRFNNYETVRINHLGDWGTQYGKLIYAHLTWGSTEELKKDPVMYLLEIYRKFNAEAKKNPKLNEEARKWFKKLEEGDREAEKLWGIFRTEGLKEFEKIYKILGVEFDSYNGEAFYNDKMKPILELAKKKKLAEEDEGALIIPLEGIVPLMLLKSDGATTYALRDLAALNYRMKTYNPVKIVYVVAAEQTLHFKQLFAAGRKLFDTKAEWLHLPFGFYLGKDGKKMATREGEVVLLEDVLLSVIQKANNLIEVKNPALKNRDEVAKKVGVGAVFFGDLMNDRIKDIVFDWDKILDFEGDTGPYLQYTHARAASIIRKAGIKPTQKIESKTLKDKTEAKLVRVLSIFPEKVQEAMKQYKPHLIAQYCLELGRSFNEFYHKCSCINEKHETTKKARLCLIEASRQVLANGLKLLNIEPLDEM